MFGCNGSRSRIIGPDDDYGEEKRDGKSCEFFFFSVDRERRKKKVTFFKLCSFKLSTNGGGVKVMRGLQAEEEGFSPRIFGSRRGIEGR